MKTIKLLQQGLFIAALFIANTMATAQERQFKGENDPQVFTEVRSFLKALNSGNGNTATTWTCGQIPTAAYDAIIENGHAVTLPNDYQ